MLGGGNPMGIDTGGGDTLGAELMEDSPPGVDTLPLDTMDLGGNLLAGSPGFTMSKMRSGAIAVESAGTIT